MASGTEFTLTVLGTGSAVPVPHRYPSAHALSVRGRSFLVDCSEGTQHRLVRAGIHLHRIDAVFISHIHGDHCYGLDGLLSTLAMTGKVSPVDIYGPVGLGPMLNFFASTVLSGHEGQNLYRFHPLKYNSPLAGGEPFPIHETKAMVVTAVPLLHGIDTFGYVFREKTPPLNVHRDCVHRYNLTLTEIGTLKKGEDVLRADGTVIPAGEAAYVPFNPRSYAYISDTRPFPKEASFVQGVDILYHEATYCRAYADRAHLRFHSTAGQAAGVALEAGVGKLVVGHYSSTQQDEKVYEGECREIFPNTVAANDGDVFDLPFERLGE